MIDREKLKADFKETIDTILNVMCMMETYDSINN